MRKFANIYCEYISIEPSAITMDTLLALMQALKSANPRTKGRNMAALFQWREVFGTIFVAV